MSIIVCTVLKYDYKCMLQLVLFYVSYSHYSNIIDSTKFPENQMVCNCLPTCSMIEYEVTDTSHFDDWNYLKLTNLVKNKYVIVSK